MCNTSIRNASVRSCPYNNLLLYQLHKHIDQGEDLLDIVVDEYLAEVTGVSTGLPDDANDIMDWVFGCEDL